MSAELIAEKLAANINTRPFQYPVIPQPHQEEISVKFLQEKRNQINSVQTFLRKFNRISFYEMPKVLSLAWETTLEIEHAFEDKHYQFEDFSDSNDDSTSIDDDSFSIDNIEFVEASPPDSELVSLEVVEIVIPEVGGIDADILLIIKDDILREKLLNINLLIAKIKALKDNLTPSSDFMTKSSSTSLNFLLEETNTVDNSLPESKTFRFDSKEISTGSTTTRSHISLPDYEAFYDDHVKEISNGSTTTPSDFSLMIRSSLIFRSIHFLLPIGVTFIMRSSPMNSLTSYLHRSMIVSPLRMNPTRGISLWMWWMILFQQENQEFMCIMFCPPFPPFN
nr:hypothetical protein [Tanacetum cinerariifolium]